MINDDQDYMLKYNRDILRLIFVTFGMIFALGIGLRVYDYFTAPGYVSHLEPPARSPSLAYEGLNESGRQIPRSKGLEMVNPDRGAA
jgi:hypothetical protein